MCTYNGERYIGPQLASIAAQDRQPDELVVCDDGSSDACPEIVREFARHVPFPTRLFVNEVNLGSTKNFEKAISLCRGEIVVLADQDDVWYRNKLSRTGKAFLRSNTVVAAFSDADLIDADSKPLHSQLWDTFGFGPEEQRRFANGDALNVLVRRPVVTGATMAFRREVLDLLAPIPSNFVHDWWISFLLAAHGQFEVISEPLIQYRRHGAQQMGPGLTTLREQAARARNTSSEFYLEELRRFHQLCERLEEHRSAFPNAQCALRSIEGKIVHLKHRADLPYARIARIPSVLWQTVNGNYWRYAAGWKSIAKDLLVP
jgi:glycosyltransferase involved in cell wall biosynthesis